MGVLVVESEAADPWIPPPPKKKWIRHYLRGEIPKDYTTFSSSAAAELSPLASSPPSPPSVPAPPQNHLPTTNGLCSYSPPSSSASSSPPPPIAYSRPLPSPPPPPPHPTPPADTHLPPLREDTPPPLPRYLASSSSPLGLPLHHHALPASPLQPPPQPLSSSSSSSTTAPILHNHLHQHQLHQQRPPSPRSACTSPSSSSSVSVPSSSSAAAHNPPFHDFQAADGGYAGVKSEDGDGSSGGGAVGGGAISSSSSPSRTFRRITVSSQLARLEEAQELRRRVGSGTREVHNKLEKNRRAHLKECFELLKKQLPTSQDEKKSSNLSILHSALRYIQSLKRKERDYEHEMERLAREKIASQQRLSALKKELSAQWDHIDFNALLPPDSVLSATGGGASPRRAPEDEEEEEREDSVMGADGGNSSYGDRMRLRKELGLPITSDHNSNSTSTASERGHLSDDVEDVLPYRSNVPFPRGPPVLLCHSIPPGAGKRSPRPIHGGSTPTSPTPPPPPPPQRSSVLQQHRLTSPSATPPSSLPASPTHTPPPRPLPAPGSPRPTRRLSPTRQMLLPEMYHHHPEEVGIAVTTMPTAHVHVPAQVVRAPPGLATALVSPGTAIHLLTTSSHNHQRHHIPGLYQTTAHGPHLQQLRVPTTSSTSTTTSPKAASPISPNSSSPSSPLLLGSPSQQPLALTVHAHPATNHHFQHSSQVVSMPHKCRDQDSKTPAVSSTSSATAISVPTIHLAGKVVQHSMAFLGPPTTTTAPGASELSHELEGAITSSSSGKYASPQHHHLQQQPTVAITGGSITLPNGVVAHASSANAGVTITQAVSPTNSARGGSLPTSLTIAHSPTSAGGTTTMLTTAIHGAGTSPISALPTHLTQAGITHLVAPIGGGHAALVTTSGAGAGSHPLMAPLALVSSSGGPVAAHILGTAPASSSGAVGATVGGKVMASGTAGALPLLKPVAVGGQLPLMNAQYLTTAAALGGLAHLVKPLVVVSSAPSAPNHGSSSKLPSSLASHSEPSPPQ